MWKAMLMAWAVAIASNIAIAQNTPTTAWKLRDDAPLELANVWQIVQDEKAAKVQNAVAQLRQAEAAAKISGRRDRSAMRAELVAAKRAVEDARRPEPVVWPGLRSMKQPGYLGRIERSVVRRIVNGDQLVINPMDSRVVGYAPGGAPLMNFTPSSMQVLVRGIPTASIREGQPWCSPPGVLLRVAGDTDNRPERTDAVCDVFPVDDYLLPPSIAK